jgi:hypothetical protein
MTEGSNKYNIIIFIILLTTAFSGTALSTRTDAAPPSQRGVPTSSDPLLDQEAMGINASFFQQNDRIRLEATATIVSNSSVRPGDTVKIKYTVTNIGDSPSDDDFLLFFPEGLPADWEIIGHQLEHGKWDPGKDGIINDRPPAWVVNPK